MTPPSPIRTPWDQRVARILARPLVGTPVSPNQVTLVTIMLTLAGAVLLGLGSTPAIHWGAGLFVLGRFLDHVDGELARQSGKGSRLGYYLDYSGGVISYGALFVGIAIGLARTADNENIVIFGAVGLASAVLAAIANMAIDRVDAGASGKDSVGYPAYAGFELEDGIYLLAPITWLGWLGPFFYLAGIGAAIYCLWCFYTLVRIRRLRNTVK